MTPVPVRILAVDDFAGDRSRIAASLESASNIECQFAVSKDDAIRRIDRYYFDVALVDLHLGSGPTAGLNGFAVLQHLLLVRPSCRRIAMTDKLDPDLEFMAVKDVFDISNPTFSLCDGLIDKRGEHDVLRSTLRQIVEQLQITSVDVPVELVRKLTELASKSLNTKAGKGRRPSPGTIVSQPEVRAVLARLFGRGERRIGLSTNETSDEHDYGGEASTFFSHRSCTLIDISTVGRSGSVVCFVRVDVAEGLPGAIIALKLSRRSDTIEECRRYNRFVRYAARHAARPDLLGLALGDSIGIIAYSFGGRGTVGEFRAPEDLEGLVRSTMSGTDVESPGTARVPVERVVTAVMGPRESFWYSKSVFVRAEMLGLCSQSFRLDFDAAVKELHRVGTQIGRINGISYVASGREKQSVGAHLELIGGRKVPIPNRSFFRYHPVNQPEHFRACIVHGDLNLSNVICASAEDVMVIDFRHTALGPRFYDFAALGAHFRMVEADEMRGLGHDVSSSFGAVRTAIDTERSAWSGKELHPNSAARVWESSPFTRHLVHLGNEVFRAGTIDGRSLQQEFMFTMTLYCLRLLSIGSVSMVRKVRLVLTIAVLCEYLE